MSKEKDIGRRCYDLLYFIKICTHDILETVIVDN